MSTKIKHLEDWMRAERRTIWEYSCAERGSRRKLTVTGIIQKEEEISSSLPSLIDFIESRQ